MENIKDYSDRIEQEVETLKRNQARDEKILAELKTEEDNLRLYGKFTRAIKIIFLELTASTLEALVLPVQGIGMRIRFDEIRERKTPNRYKEKKKDFNLKYFPLDKPRFFY